MELKDNPKIQAYLRQVCSQIKFKDAHPQIQMELVGHLEELVAEYQAQGLAGEEAIDMAIAQMGEAVDIGQRLNQIHKPRPDWGILALTLLFAGLGLAALFLTSNQLWNNWYTMVLRGSIITLIGMGAATGIYFLDYRKIKPYSKHIYLGTLLLLLYVMFDNLEVQGRSRLYIGGLFLDVVSLSPFLWVLALAGIFENWKWHENKPMILGMLLLFIPLALIIKCNSLSTGLIYLAAALVLVAVSGMQRKRFLAVAGIGVGGILLYFTTFPNSSWERITSYLHPKADQGTGYLYVQLQELMANSGLFGQGLTLHPEHGFVAAQSLLTGAHTDFIFAYITYTFGWLTGLAVVALVTAFLWRLARIARTAKMNYGKLVISGFVTIFTVQFLWHILMNLGLAPIGGVGLPLISYGGSQFIIHMAAIGLISGIYSRRLLTWEQV